MPASILSIGTAVPRTRVDQSRLRDIFAGQPGADRLTRRLITAAFDAAAIYARHTVLDDLGTKPDADRAADTDADTDADVAERMPALSSDGILLTPPTTARNDAFIRLAPPLFADAGRTALREASVEADEVTHVVTVSCTGVFAPGPDYRLVRDLGLRGDVQRFHLGFVGCAAALPALRLAAALCAAEPHAVVLVVCGELCTLHFQVSSDPEQIVAASVFADGAAATVVSARPDLQRGARLELDRFATTLTSEGESDMAWTIGDAGFRMTLSAEVPRIIGREIRGAVASFLGDDEVDAWAIHPGGRSVLDRAEEGLGLAPDALDASRAVLRTHGNMSSATILFILRAMLRDSADAGADGRRIATLAFGPGLTVESALLTVRDGARRDERAATTATPALAPAALAPSAAAFTPSAVA